jgi:hypothetical protein
MRILKHPHPELLGLMDPEPVLWIRKYFFRLRIRNSALRIRNQRPINYGTDPTWTFFWPMAVEKNFMFKIGTVPGSK